MPQAFNQAEQMTEGIFVMLKKAVVDRVIKRRPEWARFVLPNGQMLVRAKKAWYGLASSPAVWNREITTTLEVNGYKRHPLVECLYLKWTGKVPSIIQLFVDDCGVCFAKDGKERKRMLGVLTAKYGQLHQQTGNKVNYIGMEITRVTTTESGVEEFHVTQLAQIAKVNKKFDMDIDDVVAEPAKRNFMDAPTGAQADGVSVHQYKSLVASLRYIAALTHVTLGFHCGYLSSQQTCPTVKNMEEAKQLLRHINYMKDRPVRIRALGSKTRIEGRTYMDASHRIYNDGRGHNGIAVFIGNAGAAMYFKSKKHECQVLSSTDAETVCVTPATLVGDFYKRVLAEFNITCTMKYLEDNTNVIEYAEGGFHEYSQKRKFIVNRINEFHEYFSDKSNDASIHYVKTTQNCADSGTKVLFGKRHSNHDQKMRGEVSDLKELD